jgi:hypothetical protein
MGCGIVIYLEPRYNTKLMASNDVPMPEQLPPMMIVSVIFPMGLFLFAWVSESVNAIARAWTDGYSRLGTTQAPTGSRPRSPGIEGDQFQPSSKLGDRSMKDPVVWS